MRFRLNSPYVVSETIDGETIIIHLGTGAYYSLTNGDAVWPAILRCGAEESVVRDLEATFSAAPGEIATAVRQLVDELRAEELLVEDLDVAAPDQEPAMIVSQRRPFVAPVLSKYTDMQDLVLLDPVHEVSPAGWPQTEAQARGV